MGKKIYIHSFSYVFLSSIDFGRKSSHDNMMTVLFTKTQPQISNITSFIVNKFKVEIWKFSMNENATAYFDLDHIYS